MTLTTQTKQMVRRKIRSAAASGYIRTTPTKTFLGRSGRENSGIGYMGEGENRNGSRNDLSK